MYLKHTRTLSYKVPYEFRCEHCGTRSGILTAIIKSRSTYDSSVFGLNQRQEVIFEQKSLDKLQVDLYTAQENERNGKYGEFKDICAHCGKSQSWALKAFASARYSYAIGCLIWGVIAAFFVSVQQPPVGTPVKIMAFLGPSALAFLFAHVKYMRKKAKARGATTKELPVIYWPQIIE